MKAYGSSGGSEMRATPPGPGTRPGPPRKHPGPLRTAQESAKSAQKGSRVQGPPGAAQEAPRRDPGGPKNTQLS